jgi:hypothetical protein
MMGHHHADSLNGAVFFSERQLVRITTGIFHCSATTKNVPFRIKTLYGRRLNKLLNAPRPLRKHH